MQCERKKNKSVIETKTTTTTITTRRRKGKNTLHIDFHKQTNVKTHVCICAM